MPKNKKRKRNKYDDDNQFGIRKSEKRKSKHGRKKDKKYLKDMLQGNIDKDAYHEYNDNKR
tara:strand:- start:106 stop:288 length:183 start_codon:yes stop_codon:yes gene_type:complete